MKKIIYAVIAILALLTVGCTKETTYTFTDNTEGNSSITVTYFLYEYDGGGSTVAHHQINSLETGKVYEFTATSHAEKVKVKMKLDYGSTSESVWVQQVYPLDEGKCTSIVIDGNTIVGRNEP